VTTLSLRWPAIALAPLLFGCASAHLSPEAAAVELSPSPPAQAGLDPSHCQALAVLVGQAGDGFRGWVPGQDVVTTAMNDLRKQAAALGANYVQHDPPVPGTPGNMGSSTIPTTVRGTAYRCDRNMGDAGAVASAEGDASVNAPPPADTGAFSSGSAPGAANSASTTTRPR
jgi:hypothetical protein